MAQDFMTPVGSCRISVMRQVQLTAGTLALAGAIGGALLHPALHLLSGIVGAGLIVAGITGQCPMANLLAAMPWNRRTV